jgi:hypothetical protein
MHFLLRTDDGPLAEACSSFQARRRARCRRFLSPPPRPGSAFFGSSARGTCRQRRHLGRRGRRDMAGRDARQSTDRPTRAGSLSAPQACLLRLRPSARIAGDISGQERRQPPLDPLSAQCSFPPPLTLGSRRWHKLNSAPRAETDQRRSRQAPGRPPSAGATSAEACRMAAPWSTPVGCRSGHEGPLRVEFTDSIVAPRTAANGATSSFGLISAEDRLPPTKETDLLAWVRVTRGGDRDGERCLHPNPPPLATARGRGKGRGVGRVVLQSRHRPHLGRRRGPRIRHRRHRRGYHLDRDRAVRRHEGKRHRPQTGRRSTAVEELLEVRYLMGAIDR